MSDGNLKPSTGADPAAPKVDQHYHSGFFEDDLRDDGSG